MERRKLFTAFRWGMLPILPVMLLLVIGCGKQGAGKPKIEKLDDLPRYTYTIDKPVMEVLDDEAALQTLMAAVKKDLLNDLNTYDIVDKTTLKSYYSTLAQIALIEGDDKTYMTYSDKARALEEKEPAKLMMGMFGRALIAERKATENGSEVFRKSYQESVDNLSYEVCQDELKSTKGQLEIISANLLQGVVEAQLQPVLDQSNGEMSKDIAVGILGMYHTMHNVIPRKDIMHDVLAAYLAKVPEDIKPDIWAERQVVLSKKDKGKPVVVAVWDSGADFDVFKSSMWTNDKEKPGNGKDDDGNGFIDDVHGIGFTLHADKTADPLYPIGDVADRPRLQMLMKGLIDMQSNIESDEASKLKQIVSQMQPDEVKPFMEDISKYGNYCHGTHVAGIALRDNPFAELLYARMTFGHTMIPELPTIEQARKDSAMYIETVNYFKDHGVRVVNMSWGGSLAGVEGALEMNNAGGTPEERKALARKIYEISVAGLKNAIKSAPEILFVTSAGNSDNDVVFEEVYPSSMDYPNIMSVGAVDQAGEETGFTSFGKVDVYANGFEVLSFVPGGDEMKLSGTSQASPNVTNLAAKLWAMNPDLTVAQVRSLIVDSADERKAGERSVKLMNPKKSFEMLNKM